ncbi:MAG: STAS domain-containing protein [Candidatus Omnitrophota bacterium]
MISYIAGTENLICRFEDRMDTVQCLASEKEIFGKIQSVGTPIVFDLEKVAYIASSFLRICIRACKEVGAERFSLIHVCPEIKKVFKIASLDRQINIQ